MACIYNGQALSVSEEPVLRAGKHYVPLEEVVHGLGGQVQWYDRARTGPAPPSAGGPPPCGWPISWWT